MKKKFEAAEYDLPDGIDSIEALIAKLTEVTGRVPTLEQQAALAAKFEKWGNPDDLEARLNLWVQKQVKDQIEAAKAAGATKKEQTAIGNEILDRWADLSPQEQINYMTAQIGGGIEAKVTQMAQAYWAEAQKQLGAATGTNQQQFDLLARALDLKLKNPDLELSEVWKTMTELATAKPEQLMEIAMKSVRLPKERETWEKESRAKWEAEAKDKADAEKLKVLNSDSVPSWLKPKEERVSLNQPGGEDAMKNSILSKALQNGSLRPEQI